MSYYLTGSDSTNDVGSAAQVLSGHDVTIISGLARVKPGMFVEFVDGPIFGDLVDGAANFKIDDSLETQA